MSSNINNLSSSANVQHSDPIPIASRNRGRSVSVSSASSGSSSTFDIQTPMSSSPTSQRISIPSPSGSPILSYFLSQSPTKAPANATYPFKRAFPPPPVPEDEEIDKDLPVATHMRRASVNVAGRFTQPQPNAPIPESQRDRGTGFLRRLSLGSSFARPQLDSGSPMSPTAPATPPSSAVTNPTDKRSTLSTSVKHRRATTAGESGRARRAPSPMGERILRGHFDGFN
ncbi:hypothetical protein AX15_004140 [Amanita polypyramis BW_CC]|nr:hypothetical protein AX15_004140 [Amanita polypyramis BW_CC]